MNDERTALTASISAIDRRELLQLLAATSLTFVTRPLLAQSSVESAEIKPFALDTVRLLEGSFKTAQELDARYLLSLEPDRLLHNFRVNAGLAPKAPVYGGWESQEPWVEIRCHGHTLGHYLSACSMMFASTGDERLKQRVDYIVSELAACQRAKGSGIVCAFPDAEQPLIDSLHGKPFPGVPWYTMHKVLAGLRDAHLYTHSTTALQVMRGVCDWIDAQSRATSDTTLQTMLNTEHGGMVEVLADLNVMTGEARYLALSRRFVHRTFLVPLEDHRDVLDGLHSNTQIPKVIGLARLDSIQPRQEYREATQFFWRTVTERRSFATGGNGDFEHFFPVSDFAQHLSSAKTMETCCAHNMLRLTRALALHSPSVEYFDYYERTLFNAIRGSQDPDSGMMTYFQPTRPGYLKLYCTPTDSFWCCTGSGMENHAKYGESVYFHDDDSLFVTQFIASELNWHPRGVRVIQRTRFPDESATQLTLHAKRPQRFQLQIRHPVWCTRVEIRLNGKPLLTSDNAGTWVAIDRTWRDGDVLDVALPMTLSLAPLPHAPEFAALMYGPIVLAGRFGTEGLTKGADIIVNERTYGDMLNIAMDIPRLDVTTTTLATKVKRAQSERLAFNVRAENPQRDVELVAYAQIAHERYNLYWAVSTGDALVASPDGRVQLRFGVDGEGRPFYAIDFNGRPALHQSSLGLVRADADFSRGLKVAAIAPVEQIVDDYELRTIKRRLNHYVANRCIVDLIGPNDEHLHIAFQVSNDGVAFRYAFPRNSSELYRIDREASSYRFLPGTLAWMQPIAAAKTGWQSVNPSYEEIYQREMDVGTPSPTGAGWVYPALFRTNDTWLLVSESSLPRGYCGSRLQSTWRNTEYVVAFPDALETIHGGPVNPQSTLPWTTPWRFVVIGSLKTIAESTLGTDLAAPAKFDPAPYADAPGKASWSWPLMGDDNTKYDVQRRFIDYAAEMGWRYTLIDGLWDKQIGYEKVQELIQYAQSKNVRILLWYNSAGDWNTAPQAPRNLLLDHGSRIREFERLKAMGVAGLKIDFFGGDGQSVIDYYQDILEDAAPYGFVINFHGATLPRGWQRTYPNLMTMEAIRGLEFVTFEQKNAEEEPTHAAMLPFTRNVFDPMDFTPMVLDHINRIERRTTSGFELALSVQFTSGITHYAEIPEGMAKAPAYVREFLRHVPSIWDDIRFIDGFPGRYVVIARRSSNRWYVAGINAQPEALTLKLDLSGLNLQGNGELITDDRDKNLSFRKATVRVDFLSAFEITLKPNGGFVMRFGAQA